MSYTSNVTAAPVAPLGHRSGAWAGNGLAMLAMITWASSFPVADLLLKDWPALFLITLRMTLALAILAPVWVLVEWRRGFAGVQWLRGLLIGSIGFGVSAYMILVAQQMTDPVTVALIATTAPICAALLEIQAGNRRLSRRFGLGLVATVVGGMVATHGSGSAQFGLGAVLAGVSTCLWTWASMAAVRSLPGMTPLGRTTLTFAGGMVLLWVVAAANLLLGRDILPAAQITWDQVELLLIYAAVGMAFSQFLWIAAVERLGVGLASFHMNLSPFYVMLIMLGLGAGWQWQQAYGAVLVAAGVLIVQQRRARS